MFSTGPAYNKLKTNLRLSVNRLKLLEKKKTELCQKARKEIADYIMTGKYERAKIRVEHIIREDYLVEAMELIEMYCDLLLARFGLIQQMKTLDEGLAEAISSLIWVAPRMQADIAELKVISDQLAAKYGKQYALACVDNAVSTVNEKLMHKLSVQAPPKILVERYLVEIAKSHNVPYEPDPSVMNQEQEFAADAMLIDFDPNVDSKKPGGGSGGGGMSLPPMQSNPNNIGFVVGQTQIQPPGFVVGPAPVPMPSQSYQPFNYPQKMPKDVSDFDNPPPLPSVPPSAPYPSLSVAANFPGPEKSPIPFLDNIPAPPYDSVVNNQPSPQMPIKPVPTPRGKNVSDTFPELPSVPQNSLPAPGNEEPGTNDDVDFDDLTKRFEALKKKK